MFCINCGREFLKSEKYCSNCGTKAPFPADKPTQNYIDQRTNATSVTLDDDYTVSNSMQKNKSKRKRGKQFAIWMIVFSSIIVIALCLRVIISSLIGADINHSVSFSTQDETMHYSDAIILNEGSPTGAEFSCTLDEFISNYNSLLAEESDELPALFEEISKSDVIFSRRTEENFDVYEYQPFSYYKNSITESYEKKQVYPLDWFVTFFINPNNGRIHDIQYAVNKSLLESSYDTEKAAYLMKDNFLRLLRSLGIENSVEDYRETLIKESENNQQNYLYLNGILFGMQFYTPPTDKNTEYLIEAFAAYAQDAYQALISGYESKYPRKIEIVNSTESDYEQPTQTESDDSTQTALSQANESMDYYQSYISVFERYTAIANGTKTYDEYSDMNYYLTHDVTDSSRVPVEAEGVSSICRSTKTIGYELMDIDGNGIDELLIGNSSPSGENYLWDNVIFDMYTLVNNDPVRIFVSGDRYTYNLLQNNRLLFKGSDSASMSTGKIFEYANASLAEITNIASYEEYVLFESEVKSISFVPIQLTPVKFYS